MKQHKTIGKRFHTRLFARSSKCEFICRKINGREIFLTNKCCKQRVNELHQDLFSALHYVHYSELHQDLFSALRYVHYSVSMSSNRLSQSLKTSLSSTEVLDSLPGLVKADIVSSTLRVATFLQSCGAQAQGREDGPRHLHAST